MKGWASQFAASRLLSGFILEHHAPLVVFTHHPQSSTLFFLPHQLSWCRGLSDEIMRSSRGAAVLCSMSPGIPQRLWVGESLEDATLSAQPSPLFVPCGFTPVVFVLS